MLLGVMCFGWDTQVQWKPRALLTHAFHTRGCELGWAASTTNVGHRAVNSTGHVVYDSYPIISNGLDVEAS